MCERCNNKVVAKKWITWAGVIATLTLFVLSQVFMYGKVVGVVEEHIKTAPTYKGINEQYVDKDEFEIMKDMIFYLYKKEGGQ